MTSLRPSRILIPLAALAVLLGGCGAGTEPPPPPPVTQLPQDRATLLYPGEGALVDPYERPFEWNSVAGAESYYLYIGTVPGARDIYESFEVHTTSRFVFGLLPGRRYHARLYTKNGGIWLYQDSAFTTAAATSIERAQLLQTVDELTAAVRLMTAGITNVPRPGTPLAQVVADRGSGIAFCTEYALTLIDLLRQRRITARLRTISLNGAETHAVAEYYLPQDQRWSVADPTFGLTYFDPATSSGQSVEQLSQLVQAEDWSAMHFNFVTDFADGVMRNYYLDPVVLFLNPMPMGGTIADIPGYSPEPFLDPLHIEEVEGVAGRYILRFASAEERVVIRQAGEELVIAPYNSPEWSISTSLAEGWSFVESPTGLQVYRFRRFVF